VRGLVLVLFVAAVAGLAWLVFRPDRAVRGRAAPGQVADGNQTDAATHAAPAQKGPLTGTVLFRGRPAAARVTIWTGSPRRQVRSFQTSGRFTTGALEPGSYDFVARGDSGVGANSLHVRARGQRARIEIRLAPAVDVFVGRVVFRDQSPAAGATVSVRTSEGHEYARTTTSADGSFRAMDLPRGRVLVEATVEGRIRRVDHAVSVPHDGPYTLVLDHSMRLIRGKVVAYSDDRPLTGARVELGDNLWTTHATTNAHGEYEILIRDRYARVVVRANGYATRKHLSYPGPPDFRLTRLHKSARIVARTVPPRGGLAVRIRDAHGDRTGETDARGRYATEVVAGQVMARCLGTEFVDRRAARSGPDAGAGENPLAFFVRPGEVQEVVWELVPTVTATGRVLDPDGRPVPGALVRSGSRLNTVTGTDGRFTLKGLIPDRDTVLFAEAPGYLPARGYGRKEFEIRFARPRTIVVTVTDETGAPVVDATVSDHWHTGPDGIARVTPIKEGEVRINIEAPGHFPFRDHHVTGDQVTATLRRAGFVRVRVLDPEGKPLRATVWSNRQSASTGSDGWARIEPLEEVPQRVRAQKQGFAASMKSASTGDSVVFTLRRAPKRPPKPKKAEPEWMVVRILDPEGRPVPECSLWVARPPPKEPNFFFFNEREPYESQVQDGIWRIRADAKNKLEITAYRARTPNGGALRFGAASLGEVIGTGTYTLRLPVERTIRGRALGPGSRPLAGLLVHAYPADRMLTRRPSQRRSRHLDQTRTAADGSFVIRRLGDGRVAIVVAPPPGLIPAGVVFARPGQQDVVVRMGSGRGVTVTVVDPASRPVLGARVTAWLRSDSREQRPGHWNNKGAWSARTNARGEASIGGLEQRHKYRLWIWPPDHLKQDLTLRAVEPWAVADTTVDLKRRMTLAGTVRDSKGRPRPEATLRVSYEHGVGDPVRIDAKGRWRLDKVPEGQVRITCYIEARAGRNSIGKPVTARAGDTGVVVIVDLPPAIRLRFENWPGARYGKLRAMESGEARRELDATVRDGRVDLLGLTAGKTYDLFLGPLPGGLYYAANNVRPSDTIRTVRLRQGRRIAGRVIAPVGATRVTVTIDHPLWGAQSPVGRDGTFLLEGIPDGSWTVVAKGRVGQRWTKAAAIVEAGGSAVLELR